MPGILEEEDIALSPTFIDFLAQWLSAPHFGIQVWPDQRSEELHDHLSPMAAAAAFRLQRLLLVDEAQAAIRRVLYWVRVLAVGQIGPLEELHQRFTFLVVVGIPRTGGSYLTSEIYRALGHDSRHIPAAIAHDGFPEGRPFVLSEGRNAWIDSLVSMSEYLVMLELFFADSSHTGTITVPKKATKAAYVPGLFRSVFGRKAEYIVTVRHPVPCCISSYEKSGGLPREGAVRPRSAIERWMLRDTRITGARRVAVDAEHYFEVYLRYWEQFHISLVLSGLFAHRDYRVVAFGKTQMEETAQNFHSRFGSTLAVQDFATSTGSRSLHPSWWEMSCAAIDRVHSVWRSVGVPFPYDELLSSGG